MSTFIQSVLKHLKDKGNNLEDLYFILPSKRAGVFLKHHLSTLIKNPIFAPHILSIEEFVEEISGLKTLSNTDTLFQLYNAYIEVTPKESREPFDVFCNWAQILIQDFNEIDRYLGNQETIFDYLHAIKELDHWSLEAEPTSLVKSYLKFWKQLKTYYQVFSDNLLKNKQGYQGLVYREAVESLEAYIENNTNKNHVFLGSQG